MPTSLAPAIADFPVLEMTGYRLRMAQSLDDLRRVQHLRFEVFNLELGEGFPESYESELDRDHYDPHNQHLMVEEMLTGAVVGTYRLQTQAMAESGAGFYTASEYDLSAMQPLLPQAAEASRACVHKSHREGAPIQLLWRGIARFLVAQNCRYLFGLTSLTSQDPVEGVRGWQLLRKLGNLHPELRVRPLPEFECLPPEELERSPLPPLAKLPPLFDAYMRIATRIVGYPAIDRSFGTIDYLALLDLEELPPLFRRRVMP